MNWSRLLLVLLFLLALVLGLELGFRLHSDAELYDLEIKAP